VGIEGGSISYRRHTPSGNVLYTGGFKTSPMSDVMNGVTTSSFQCVMKGPFDILPTYTFHYMKFNRFVCVMWNYQPDAIGNNTLSILSNPSQPAQMPLAIIPMLGYEAFSAVRFIEDDEWVYGCVEMNGNRTSPLSSIKFYVYEVYPPHGTMSTDQLTGTYPHVSSARCGCISWITNPNSLASNSVLTMDNFALLPKLTGGVPYELDRYVEGTFSATFTGACLIDPISMVAQYCDWVVGLHKLENNEGVQLHGFDIHTDISCGFLACDHPTRFRDEDTHKSVDWI
jgi:hypothetical protein